MDHGGQAADQKSELLRQHLAGVPLSPLVQNHMVSAHLLTRGCEPRSEGRRPLGSLGGFEPPGGEADRDATAAGEGLEDRVHLWSPQMPCTRRPPSRHPSMLGQARRVGRGRRTPSQARECFELADDDEVHPDGKRAWEAPGVHGAQGQGLQGVGGQTPRGDVGPRMIQAGLPRNRRKGGPPCSSSHQCSPASSSTKSST